MKSVVMFFAIVLSFSASAQWNTSGNDIASTNSGNVGIGTFAASVTPASKLHVYEGDLRITSITANRSLIFDASSAINLASLISMRRDNSLRWQFGSAGNFGADNFEFFRHSDVGGFLGSVLKLERATGNAIFSGNVCIGTSAPGSFKMVVEGKAGAREFIVTTTNPWPDYVFENSYKLPDLSEIKAFVSANKHLPGVPSKADVEKNGHHLGQMDVALLQKVEELTLYLIQLKEENEKLKSRVETLEKR